MALTQEELRRLAAVEEAVKEARQLAQHGLSVIERHLASCEVLQRTTVQKLSELSDGMKWSGRYLLGLLATVLSGIIVELLHTSIVVAH